MYSRIRPMGLSYSNPCQDASVALAQPIPKMKRPWDSSFRVAARIPAVTGERAKMWYTAVPSSMRVVRAAMADRTTIGSRVLDSPFQMAPNPFSSAMGAASRMPGDGTCPAELNSMSILMAPPPNSLAGREARPYIGIHPNTSVLSPRPSVLEMEQPGRVALDHDLDFRLGDAEAQQGADHDADSV